MDSDDDFLDDGKPSTSSGKGPPPFKRYKPLTAAERKRRSRAAQSEEKKMEEALKNKERKAKKRATQSADQKREEYVKNRERKASARAGHSSTVKDEAKVKACERMSRQRHKARTKVSYKDGLRSQEIMDGSYLVPDLENSEDKIGDMDIICQYCGALKFQKETSSTCCGNGKVVLDPFPVPPPEINNLWHADDTEGRIFRENSRAINNSVCLREAFNKKNIKSCGSFHNWSDPPPLPPVCEKKKPHFFQRVISDT